MSAPVGSSPDAMMAFFVGGPQNGATMWLAPGTIRYRFPVQATLDHLAHLSTEAGISVSSLKCDEYVRTKEMTYLYLRGCWIFEWMGAS